MNHPEKLISVIREMRKYLARVSMSSGWSLDFLKFAEQFDEAYAIAKRGS